MTAAELFDVKGRVALVTGASSGLGVRFAELLAGEGAAVALVARRADRLAAVKARIDEAGGRAVAIAADVTEDFTSEAVTIAHRLVLKMLRQVEPGDIDLEEHARAQRNAVQLQHLAIHLHPIFELHTFQLGRLRSARQQREREHPKNHIRCSSHARWRGHGVRSGIACSQPRDSS